MSKYDHYVQTEKIRPIGNSGIEWAAKATVQEIGTHEKIVLHEHLGKSKSEAASKADDEAREWIAAHDSK